MASLNPEKKLKLDVIPSSTLIDSIVQHFFSGDITPKHAEVSVDITPKHAEVSVDITPKHAEVSVDITPKHAEVSVDITPKHAEVSVDIDFTNLNGIKNDRPP